MEPENEESLVKITDICRACLARTDNMKFLLDNNEETIGLLSKFASVANMEIELSFKYPSYLCTICEGKIITSYEFQQQCHKSNDLVYEYLAAFAKQGTITTEGESQGTLKNSDISEEVNIVQMAQNNIESLDCNQVEIANTVTTPICAHSKSEYDIPQDVLTNAILDLKQKYINDDSCVFCDFQASTRKTLSVHVSRVHKELKNTWCSICNKVFSNLEAHLVEAHKDGFVCQFCQLQFSTVKTIIEHLYSHQGVRENIHTEVALPGNNNICHVCNENFESQECLIIHARTYVGKCQFCSKRFSTKNLLENHKCSRVRRKNNKEIRNTDEIKEENDTLELEHELLEKEKSIEIQNLPEELKKKSRKTPVRSKALQRMRLIQYSVEDVDKAISVVREKFYKHVTCIFCSFTAVTNRSLSVHVTRVHREYKGRWCSSCNQITENQSLHNKEVHYEDLKCPFCKRIKANMGHFMEHLASHSVERLHKCDICYKSFISLRHLRIHRETHVKERPFKCKLCQKLFLQANQLKSHLKAHESSVQNVKDIESDSIENDKVKDVGKGNDENENLSCQSDYAEEAEEVLSKPHNYCKECNRNVRSLPGHYRKHHNKTNSANGEKQNLCPHCGKRFKTRSKLTVHIRTHTGESPYKCQYCDKRVKTRNILVVHERTHTGEKPYMCTVCGKSFAQSSVLNTHTRIHTGRPEQCTICEKRFCRPAELKLHMRKHTGEKPYTCDHCGQGFKQKSHLVEHTKTHSDDRPFKCEYCEKSFKSSGTLKCHLQIHTGQKPFKCSQCSYACRQPYSLTQHMVQHEKDKPQPDYPHRCQLCQRNYVTLAHLTAHHNRFHPGLTLNSPEKNDQPITNDQMIVSHTPINQETDQNDQDNYEISQEHHIDVSNQVEINDSVENIDAMIIQAEIDQSEIKFEPMIQFRTLQNL